MDWSLPDPSVQGILREGILEWVVIPFSRGSSWSNDLTQFSCFTSRFFTIWATREALNINALSGKYHTGNNRGLVGWFVRVLQWNRTHTIQRETQEVHDKHRFTQLWRLRNPPSAACKWENQESQWCYSVWAWRPGTWMGTGVQKSENQELWYLRAGDDHPAQRPNSPFAFALLVPWMNLSLPAHGHEGRSSSHSHWFKC